jgi:hypothetical protein
VCFYLSCNAMVCCMVLQLCCVRLAICLVMLSMLCEVTVRVDVPLPFTVLLFLFDVS